MTEVLRVRLPQRVQVCAAVGVDHSLRLAGGAGGVVDRDGLVLIVYAVGQWLFVAVPGQVVAKCCY